jgi:hypothetical protein
MLSRRALPAISTDRPLWTVIHRVRIRTGRGTRAGEAEPKLRCQPAPPLTHDTPLELSVAPTLERTVRARHEAGQSLRAIAPELNIGRRKIKRMIDQVA